MKLLESSVYHQLYSLLLFILTGFAIGTLFDLFRILRKSFKTPDIVTYIEDIIFWILTGLTTLFAIFNFHNGEIRSYIFIGIGIGVIIYILTISKYVIKWSVTFLNFILYPFRILGKLLHKFLFKPIFTFFYNSKIFIKKNLQICTKKFLRNKKVKKGKEKKDFTIKCRKI